MTKILLLSCLLAVCNFSSASEQLSQKMLDKQFSPSVIKKNAIKGNILTGYKYKDSVGKHLLLLTGNRITCATKVSDITACYDQLHAYAFADGKKLKKEWSLYDLIGKTETAEEYSIEFLLNNITIKDLDGDGRIEPILVYSTLGLNKFDDGRIKILTYYKGKKYAIRHQNDTMDGGRGTTVVKSFYKLPKPVQKKVINIMHTLEKKEKAIFPLGWKESMQKGKTKFMERKKVPATTSFKTTEAEIKGFKLINQHQAKLRLDFMNVFSSGFQDEYKRYLKKGYPKITRDEFDEMGPGGVIFMNENKKLREFVTDADTIYDAYCLNSVHANNEGIVSVSLPEFSAILDRKYGRIEGRKAIYKKHGSCYSVEGNILRIKYDGTLLKHVSFVWMP